MIKIKEHLNNLKFNSPIDMYMLLDKKKTFSFILIIN